MAIEGILPVVHELTPFRDGRFDPKSFQQMLDHMLPSVDGYTLLGSTGEAPSLSTEQRIEIAEFALETTPRDKTVVVGVTNTSATDGRRLAVHAQEHGAAGVLCAVPFYFTNSVGGIRRYLAELDLVLSRSRVGALRQPRRDEDTASLRTGDRLRRRIRTAEHGQAHRPRPHEGRDLAVRWIARPRRAMKLILFRYPRRRRRWRDGDRARSVPGGIPARMGSDASGQASGSARPVRQRAPRHPPRVRDRRRDRDLQDAPRPDGRVRLRRGSAPPGIDRRPPRAAHQAALGMSRSKPELGSVWRTGPWPTGTRRTSRSASDVGAADRPTASNTRRRAAS